MLLILTSCARQVPVVHELSPMPEGAACRVTVLPLIDKSTYPMGGSVLYKILLTELVASGNFKVVDEGDVLELYRQFRIFPNQQPTSEQLKMIGGRLGSSLFIGGDLLEMDERRAAGRAGDFLETEMAFVLRLYDGTTGNELWTTYHRRRGKDYQQVLHFGRINSITSLAKMMSREILTKWLEQGMQPCPD